MFADLVLLNGNVLTMNPFKPKAQAIAIKDDKIVKVGRNAEIKEEIGKDTRVIDLKGRTVVPGFIDTHAHCDLFGRSLTWIDLRDVRSIKEMLEKLKKRVQETPKGKWILGYGWTEGCLEEGKNPTRWDLDKVSSDNPVFFLSASGHSCVMNSKALELKGIIKEAITSLNVQIDIDPQTGEPSGILREIDYDYIPEPSEEQLTEAYRLAFQKFVEVGVTSVHLMVNSVDVRVIQKLYARGELPLRVYLMFPVKYIDSLIALGLSSGFGDNMVKVGSIKVFVDGSLEAHTAALYDSYNDEVTKGITLYSQEELNTLVMKAHKAHLQLAIHAIGDKAIDMALTAIENALEQSPRRNHRHRIEHAYVLNEKLIRRMRMLGVIASMQPYDIPPWIIDRLGPTRARWVHPFKTLLKEGITITGSSDCPVCPPNPLLGIYASVARKFSPKERITIDDALRMYTLNAAYASFEENTKGSIETGKLADLTILSHDPHKVPPTRIKDITVEMTIVGGRVVYEKFKY